MAIPSPLAALTSILRCPYCGGMLVLEDRTLICPTGHNFDLAREGYVNLSQSRQTGDRKDMLRARRRFLDAGYYQPLSDLINRLVAEHCQDDPCTVLDAGCGEGYYLGRLSQHLAGQPASLPSSTGNPRPQSGARPRMAASPIRALGLDAAKEAARMAASRYRAAAFLVADLTECLPLADEQVNALLNVFAPRHAKEFARVLRPDGLLLSVIPEPNHLGELRRLLPLLGIEDRKEEQVRATLGREFVPAGAEHLSYPFYLAGEALGDLVWMTPSARHLDDAARADLAAVGSTTLPLTASFFVLSFRPRYT
ncbi:MAG: putative RNA methyltransferase [Chloroflexota bacterium]